MADEGINKIKQELTKKRGAPLPRVKEHLPPTQKHQNFNLSFNNSFNTNFSASGKPPTMSQAMNAEAFRSQLVNELE